MCVHLENPVQSNERVFRESLRDQDIKQRKVMDHIMNQIKYNDENKDRPRSKKETKQLSEQQSSVKKLFKETVPEGPALLDRAQENWDKKFQRAIQTR